MFTKTNRKQNENIKSSCFNKIFTPFCTICPVFTEQLELSVIQTNSFQKQNESLDIENVFFSNYLLISFFQVVVWHISLSPKMPLYTQKLFILSVLILKCST